MTGDPGDTARGEDADPERGDDGPSVPRGDTGAAPGSDARTKRDVQRTGDRHPPDDRRHEGDRHPADEERATGGGRYLTVWSAAAAGVAVAGGLAAVDAFWPALTVLAGAVTASGLLLARRGGRKRYLLAGVAYYLGLALLVEFGAGAFPAAYTTGVLPAVAGFGAISSVLVVAKVAGKRVVKRLAVVFAADEEFWGEVWEALAALGSLLSLVWLLVTFAEKVVRYGGATVGAVALLVANMLGYEVTVVLLGIEFEAVLALFVGCVLVWFHLLDTLHNSWRAVARSAEKAQQRAGADEEAAARSDG